MAETGHIKNVENLQKAVNFAAGWGAAYQPSNPILAVAAMTALVTAGGGQIDGVQVNRTPYRNATAAADDAFKPLSNLTRRIMKAAKAQGVPASVIEDADTYARKVLGERKTAVTVDDPATPDVDESLQSHSASQMSRTQRIENFESLRLLFEAQPLYAPNEVEFQTDTMKTYKNDLIAKTEAVGTTFVPYSNGMASRDDVLYINADSVFTTGTLFKAYVDYAFNRGSTEWNQIKGLIFRDLRRK